MLHISKTDNTSDLHLSSKSVVKQEKSLLKLQKTNKQKQK